MEERDGDRAAPMPNPPHPGEPIRESMDELGWNVTETAVRLHCERGTLSRLLNGRAGLSAGMALALEDLGWGTADLIHDDRTGDVLAILDRLDADAYL